MIKFSGQLLTFSIDGTGSHTVASSAYVPVEMSLQTLCPPGR